MRLKEKHALLLALLLLTLTSYFSVGYHHFDEHFQILEFAGLKLNLTTKEELPWEYRSQMRSALQPAMVVGVLEAFRALGLDENPFAIALLLRFSSAILSLVAMSLLYKQLEPTVIGDKLREWFVLLSFCLWFFVYNGVRFSSENWSGICFVIAFALYFALEGSKRFWPPVLVGLLLGLSFVFRYQAGFLTLGFLSWLVVIRKEKPVNVLAIILCIGLVALGGIFLDSWFYEQKRVLTSWNYFQENILRGAASHFGTEPWWWYIKEVFIRTGPPFSLLLIVPFFVVVIHRSKDPITWAVLPFIVVHVLIGHKELRFLFPLICFVPAIIIQALQSLHSKYSLNLTSKGSARLLVDGFLYANFALLAIVVFKPADNAVRLYETIYDKYSEPAVLFYADDANPYLISGLLNINYYKRKTLELRRTGDFGSLAPVAGKTTLLVTKRSLDGLDDKAVSLKLVHSSIPGFLYRFNFNNWLGRMDSWYVYELEATAR